MKKAVLILLSLLILGLFWMFSPTLQERRTLASLQQVDDFPLYVMRYYGDYGFAEYLETGRREISPEASRSLSRGWACTCFAALGGEQGALFGRNFDWYRHPALLLFTDPPDGYASVSLVDIAYLGFENQPVTPENQRLLLEAPYLPFDGMNEYGLAVGMMAVDHSEGGHDPEKVTLDSLEIIRLLLDYARNVDEALELLQDYNVDFSGGPPIHYMIADPAGNSVVVEYLNGEIQVIRSQTPWQVSTNFLLAEQQPPGASHICPRYTRASQTLAQADGSLSPQMAMALLEAVSQSGDFATIWSIVYNLQTGQIDVVVDREYETVHTFNIEIID